LSILSGRFHDNILRNALKGLFEKSKIPSFSATSGECRVKKPRNPKGFLRFLPSILLLSMKNSAIPLFTNKPWSALCENVNDL
jgi:hypothetical protein